MIVTGRLVFLHLHKSGGSFVNHCLRRHFPDAREIGYHLPRSMIPPSSAGLPILGLVRNPWSYYVSWYAFQRQRPQPNALFCVVSDDGRLDFNGTISNLVELGRNEAMLARVVGQLPREYGTRGLNLPGLVLARIRGNSAGFYSFLHDYMYGAADPGDGASAPLHVGRMEDLPGELLRLFEMAGQPISAACRDDILQAPARNASAHGPYASYYNPALRDLVGLREAAVITQYGYAFEG